MSTLFYGRLPHRSLIRASGKDVHGFLQGLFTNDLRRLSPGGSQYGCFLSKSGRVLFDAVLMQSQQAPADGHSAVFVEVDKTVAAFAVEHMKEFRLRRKISLENVSEGVGVVVTNDPAHLIPNCSDGSTTEVYADPRATSVLRLTDPAAAPLHRMIVAQSSNATADIAVCNPEAYDRLLIENGIYEGPKTFVKDKTLPFEANLDMMGGVSFDKGCYLGQELTHRTHVMLVTRKRSVPETLGTAAEVAFRSACDASAPEGWKEGGDLVTEDGMKVGKLQAVCGNKAVGLLRLRYVDANTRQLRLNVAGGVCTAWLPQWWDSETTEKIFASSTDE